MDIEFSKIVTPENGAIVFIIGEDLKLPAKAVELDKKTGGAVLSAIKSSGFSGKNGNFIII